MRRSTDHFIASNAGTLPRTDRLQQLFDAGPDQIAAYQSELPAAVREVVDRQVATGIEVVNDGEFSKRGGFQAYIRGRISGIEQRAIQPGEVPPHGTVTERDIAEFPRYYANGIPGVRDGGPGGQSSLGRNPSPIFCVGPLDYVGQEAIATDIANLKAAIGDRDVEPYLPVVSPGNVEHWLWNLHYADTESFLEAIADM